MTITQLTPRCAPSIEDIHSLKRLKRKQTSARLRDSRLIHDPARVLQDFLRRAAGRGRSTTPYQQVSGVLDNAAGRSCRLKSGLGAEPRRTQELIAGALGMNQSMRSAGGALFLPDHALNVRRATPA